MLTDPDLDPHFPKRTRIQDSQVNADPCGSRSMTLVTRIK
jgi:hypothetical protein